MPGPTGLLPFEAPLPRSLLRRRHRRAARRHRRRRHGDGRAATGRGDLLHVPQPGVGPGRLRRRPAPPAGGLLPSTAPASPATTGRATTACTTWRCSRKVPGHARARPVVARRSCSRCCTTRVDARRRRARSPSATRRARPARSPSTRSASGCSAATHPHAATARCASSPSARWSSRRAKAAAQLAERGHRRRRCGTCAAAARSTRR